MNIKAGMISGFVATVVLSLLMVVKTKMGLMPELNAISMLAGMMNASLIIGWIAHFMIGTIVWGILFALLVDKLPGGIMASAIIFSIIAWLMMMIGPMPMAGEGLFGMQLGIGIMAPIATLMLHIIWGIVLGLVYKKVS
tara:strand:+ start:81759 stop:82175 length:417 start_codon:yes stop_codon:yes gene_type:complete